MSTLANSPLNRLLAQNPESDGYAETSRYKGLPTHSFVDTDGKTIRYTGRRLITPPDDDGYEIHKIERETVRTRCRTPTSATRIPTGNCAT